MNVNDDFDRFDKIFGITSTEKVKKAPTKAQPKSTKRRKLPAKLSCYQLPIKRIRGNPLKKQVVRESPDKTEILAHLSCQAADFHKSLIVSSDDSDSSNEK